MNIADAFNGILTEGTAPVDLKGYTEAELKKLQTDLNTLSVNLQVASNTLQPKLSATLAQIKETYEEHKELLDGDVLNAVKELKRMTNDFTSIEISAEDLLTIENIMPDLVKLQNERITRIKQSQQTLDNLMKAES